MIGIRQLARSVRTFCGNLPALPKVVQMLCTDPLEQASISAARRLMARGHTKTISSRLPMDWDGRPIPWYTYPFIDYISDVDTSKWRILEFGSGQSTLFWAPRAASILAYENSPAWLDKMRGLVPSNVELRFFEGEKSLDELDELDFVPDLVVVDGWKRGACARRSIQAFGHAPIYILENSDWFPKAAAAMRESGLTEIRFKGFGPINGYTWATSLMVSENHLKKLGRIRAFSEVPGGLAAGDYEETDIAS